MTTDLIPLPEANGALRRRGIARPPTYNALHQMVLNGELPAERAGRRILIANADLDSLAARLKGNIAPNAQAA